MKVVSIIIIIIIRVVPPLTTPPINPLNFPKCSKGVIQRLKIVLVKTHDGLTQYRYESHMDHGTQRYGTAHGMSWSPQYGDIPARLIIIHHTYRPLALRINDVGAAS